MRTILLLWLVAAVQQPTLRWIEFRPPVYPQMAVAARINGDVRLAFNVNDSVLSNVTALSGHPILINAALESLHGSRLQCDGCGDEPRHFVVTYEFEIVGSTCDSQPAADLGPPVLESPTHVSLKAVTVCEIDPATTINRRRSLRCLYLWRCG